MKKWILAILAAPLALGMMQGAALAETQNVKVSGSIDAYGFYRSNFDLRDNNDAGTVLLGQTVPNASHGNAGDTVAASSIQRSDADSFFMTITQVEVSAALTDNVSTVVNLINQRDWNADALDAATPSNTAPGTNAATNEFDVLIDLAYVQMKEIFYSPLTLTIGRQDLVFGRGFIVGWNPQDPQNITQADEFTQIQSFDAIRATLDFSPWTLDMVYSKLRERTPNPEDDRDLYISYLTYKFSEYNAVADLYYTGEADRATLAGTTGTHNNDTHTFGGRVQFDPIEQMTLGAELAIQFGDYRGAVTSPERNREASAVDIFGEYRFDNAWKPMVGLEYIYLSGESDLGAGSTQDYGSWNGSFRGPIYGWIHDYLEVYYATASTVDQAAGQNQQSISLYGSMLPMSDLKLTAAYWYFWGTDDYHVVSTNPNSGVASDGLGHEIDLAAIYSYTEDVTFTFMADFFVPGDLYTSPNDAMATQLVSEVKVVF